MWDDWQKQERKSDLIEVCREGIPWGVLGKFKLKSADQFFQPRP